MAHLHRYFDTSAPFNDTSAPDYKHICPAQKGIICSWGQNIWCNVHLGALFHFTGWGKEGIAFLDLMQGMGWGWEARKPPWISEECWEMSIETINNVWFVWSNTPKLAVSHPNKGWPKEFQPLQKQTNTWLESTVLNKVNVKLGCYDKCYDILEVEGTPPQKLLARAEGRWPSSKSLGWKLFWQVMYVRLLQTVNFM